VVKHKFVFEKYNLLPLFCLLVYLGVCTLHLSFKAYFLFCFLLTALTFKNHDFCIESVCVFCAICRINSDYFSKQNYPVETYGEEDACLL
jgi:hypothetical protein